MIKIVEEGNKRGLKLKDPKNLIPIIYRCSECGCTIRKIEKTNSYSILQKAPEIKAGLKNYCSFCIGLDNYSVENIDEQ